MDRRFYIEMGKSGLVMPIGTDLVLREHENHHEILHDGEKLGRVIQEAAGRFGSPLAIPVMDLSLEKTALLSMLGVPADQIGTYHMTTPPTDRMMRQVQQGLAEDYEPRLAAQLDAIAWVAANTDLVPVGMTIGPFSLMTKLIADPITPLYLAGMGMTAAEEPDILMVERCLELATKIILRSLNAQVLAGAEMLFIAEPAANIAYLSPNQIDAGSDIFDRFVMKYNHRLRAALRAWDVDLFFHCCGELTPYMVKKFAELDPAVLSLGASRNLWEDAALLPRTTVLYGNLPSKQFYSDELMPLEAVQRATCDLRDRMAAVDHPFILGTECDILSVPGHEATLMCKAMGMVSAVGGNDPHKLSLHFASRYAGAHAVAS
ncbi:MAG: hypothetical protein FWE88_07680 [Phycisphaerae bacterium]|nr:hypothetical protein [Phycisphaerae bacterium]